MTNEQETSTDILASMRDYSNECNDGYHTDYGVVCTDMRNYADRLEAALKRERGDAATLREALEDSQSLLGNFSWGEYGVQVREQMRDNRAALAAPPRNCDVGTAGEQYGRWTRFCKFRNENRKTCFGCPVYAEQNKGQNSTCELIWGQMPYKEGGAK